MNCYSDECILIGVSACYWTVTNNVNSYSYRQLLASDEPQRYVSINTGLQVSLEHFL